MSTVFNGIDAIDHRGRVGASRAPDELEPIAQLRARFSRMRMISLSRFERIPASVARI